MRQEEETLHRNVGTVECWVDAQPTTGYLRHLLPCSTLRYTYHFTGKVQSVKILMLSGRCTYEGVIVKVSYFPYK